MKCCFLFFFLWCYAAVMKDAKHAPHESRKKPTASEKWCVGSSSQTVCVSWRGCLFFFFFFFLMKQETCIWDSIISPQIIYSMLQLYIIMLIIFKWMNCCHGSNLKLRTAFSVTCLCCIKHRRIPTLHIFLSTVPASLFGAHNSCHCG